MAKKIIQFHNWRANDITEELLLEVSRQGFTDIQTSPFQETRGISEWWDNYQPISFRIGNRLASKEDIKSLCERAKKYGLGVIQDIVMNHMASDWGDGKPSHCISEEIRNREDFWHNHFRDTQDWNNRYEVTQFNMAGLPDLNTANPVIQKAFIYMISEYKSLGISGFRFDAAKHIELPDDPYCGSNFWDNIINACGHSYCYGEIIYERYNLMERYSRYMKIGTNWGDGLSQDKTVLWVESHDTYNDGQTRHLEDEQINREYLRLRRDCRDSDVLYFIRPKKDSWESSDCWKSEIVREANLL